jgi:hypothetical protein
MIRHAVLLVSILGVAGCRAAGPDVSRNEQDMFWDSLHALCGSAFEGQVVQGSPGDTAFIGKTLIMHVRDCSAEAVYTAFNVGDDRSRTWIITRTENGLRLKHDHRHRDGSEDAITQYGGDTRTPGTAQRQEFFADAHTEDLIPAAATNVWTVEILPDRTFGYALRREGTDRRFRVEFDLTRAVATPSPSWGH